MREGEEADLTILKIDLAIKRERFESYLRILLGLDERGLKNSGYKTVEQAVLKASQDFIKEQNARTQKHIKKFPD